MRALLSNWGTVYECNLIGPTWSRKGTQARKIVEGYDFEYISTGDMLRKEVQSESQLGQIAKSFMNNGH